MLQEMLPKRVLIYTLAIYGMGPGMQLFLWLLTFLFFCDFQFFTLLSDFFLSPFLPAVCNQLCCTKHTPLDSLCVTL